MEAYNVSDADTMASHKSTLMNDDTPREQLVALLKKVHGRFGHPGRTKSRLLLDTAGVTSKRVRDTMSEVCDTCPICRRHIKLGSRPVVNFSVKEPSFNEDLCVDIMFFEDSMILKMMDRATRLMIADVLLRKTTSAMEKSLESKWFSYFGYPKTIYLDRATETVSAAFLQICAVHNILLHPSPAQGQHANGMIERHGAVLRVTMEKLRVEFPDASVGVLLQKSLMAHNAITNVDGSSPCFLAFGLNLSLPEFPNVNPAAANALTEDETPIPEYLKRLTIAWAARVKFAEAQTLRSLLVAAAHPARADSVAYQNFQIDDVVLFWNISVNHKLKGWRGPARVVAVDKTAKTIQMSFGANYITRHETKVRKADDITASLFNGQRSKAHLPSCATIQLNDPEPRAEEDAGPLVDNQPMQTEAEIELVRRSDLEMAQQLELEDTTDDVTMLESEQEPEPTEMEQDSNQEDKGASVKPVRKRRSRLLDDLSSGRSKFWSVAGAGRGASSRARTLPLKLREAAEEVFLAFWEVEDDATNDDVQLWEKELEDIKIQEEKWQDFESPNEQVLSATKMARGKSEASFEDVAAN